MGVTAANKDLDALTTNKLSIWKQDKRGKKDQAREKQRADVVVDVIKFRQGGLHFYEFLQQISA